MSLFRNLLLGVTRRLSTPVTFKTVHPRCLHRTCILNVEGIEIKMPSLSPTMTEGTIIKWLKKEGDNLQPGDVICEIQTDKAVVGFETEEEGVLAKILMKEDSKDVKVGTLIALMVEEGEDWKSVEIPASSGEEAAVTQQAETQQKDTKPPAQAKTATSSAMGPSVHLLLQKYGLEASNIPATGPRGNLLKGDILLHILDKGLQPVEASAPVAPNESTAPAPKVQQVTTAEYIDVELSNMRKTIAKRLTQSKTGIPHSYGTIECRIDSLLSVRKKLKADGVLVSVNDFVIKAVGIALEACPLMNVVWTGNQVTSSSNIDISVAVATDAGLITPIITNVSSKGLVQISTDMKDLASRARQNKLKLNEFQGGTFTISNLGMFGITEFSAIINPPQCGILAVGSGRPSLDDSGKICTKMCCTLSFDANAISESVAAEFMDTLRDVLEDPALIILGSGPQKQRDEVML